jgi:uncharacterized protein involved in exopolysaccharide biosynthesis
MISRRSGDHGEIERASGRVSGAIMSEQEQAFPLRHWLGILRRRKWSFLLPVLLVMAVAVAAAALWPPTWRSEATVLIEDAEIPQEIIGSLVNDYVEKRLEAIDRRVMVTDSLVGMIQRYDLYPEERRTKPVMRLVERMREDIRREMIRANVVDPRSGQRRSASIAFKLSFDYGTPETAQRITNELVTLYLNENLRQRRELATETVAFLRAERERVERQIAELESRLAAFKRENNDVLPERLPYNQQMLARAEQERRDLDRQIQSLRERESYIGAELAQLDPYLPGPEARGPASSPEARLEALRAELAGFTARYGPEHPDVVRARREVEILERSVGGRGGGRTALEQGRDRMAVRLAELRQRYSDDHPDVRSAERELAAVEDALRVAGSRPRTAGAGGRTSNPAYVTLQAQLAGIRSDLAASQEQRVEADRGIDRFQGLLLRTPEVEREYAALQRQLDDAMALRDEIAGKETATRLGQAAETELKAERLSLIEPPSLPDEPTWPNRPVILLVGLVLAIGGGVGTVALRQTLDDAVWTPHDLVEVMGAAPLAIVPRIDTAGDRARRWATAGAAGVALLVALGGGLYLADRRYGPLDVYAYELQRRASEIVRPYLPASLRPAPAGAESS